MAKNDLKDVPYAVASGNKTALVVLGVVCGVLVLSNLGFAIFAAKQFVRKEKNPEPIIFEVDKAAHRIVKVERGNLGETKESLLRSVSLRDYVEWRETINHIDEKERWKKVRLMSNNNVYKNFYTLMNPDVNEDSPFANKKFERKIEIITDYPISSKVHRVEYYATDIIDGETYPAQRYVAVIQYGSSDAFVSYEDRFINIQGLKVTRYEIYGA